MEFKKIAEILELQRGYDLPTNKMVKGDIPVVGSNGIIGYHNKKKSICPTITIGRSGSIGKVHFYDGYTWVHNTALYVKNYKDNDPLYLYYALKNLNFENLKSSSVVPSLNRNYVYPLKVPYIKDKKKQIDISSILRTIDNKITLNIRMNAELEAMAKQLYDYWFVQFDFPDENGKPYKSSGGKMVWNEKLKREIPEGWEVKTVSDCIKHVNTGLNPRQNFSLGNGSIKYITVKNLRTDGTIDYSNCDLIDEKARAKVHRRSDIQIKDVLFASIAPLGRCHIILNEPTDWDINESVFSIRPRTDYISPYYLYIYFMSEWFVQKAEKDATGSIFAGIRINTLLEIPIVVPSKYISDMFDQCVCNIFKKKDDISIECNHLTHLRDSLLPMLMNGQVTIEENGK
jgi:type I restriction enzyme S subunit